MGYAVRFDEKCNVNTKIKYMTDGILIREALNKNMLENYSVVIIDEAHERSIYSDVLLGLLKQILVS